MMRNLQALVSFAEAASAGSFTAAAARLGVTPAAVGKNVMRLERELQVRLFNRSTRQMQLTAEGEAFLRDVTKAMGALDEAVMNVTAARQEVRGRVRISSGVAPGRRLLMPLVPQLTRAHPDLQLDLALDNRGVDLIAEGYDLALRGGVVEDSRLVARDVCPLHAVLVASPAYLRKHGVPQAPADLPRHRVLGVRFPSGQVLPWRFRKNGRGKHEEWMPQALAWTSDPEGFLDLALAGEGICQAALLHVAPLLRTGRLKLVLHAHYDPGERKLVLCFPHRQLLSRRVRAVIDAVLERAARDPDAGLHPRDVPAQWLA